MIRLPLSQKLFAHRNFFLLMVYRMSRSLGMQAQSVLIGWQVYDVARQSHDIKQSAFLVGMVGLSIFAPMLFLTPIAGEAADRYNRRTIILIGNMASAVNMAILVWNALSPVPSLWPVFVSAVIAGVATTFVMPAGVAILPALVPKKMLPQAVAWNVLAGQVGRVAGPLLSGVLAVGSLAMAYGVVAGMYAVSAVVIALINVRFSPQPVSKGRWAQIVEGLGYVWGNKLVFGAISLDMVAVMLGGVTALLPVYARDILHMGADGFGMLRSGAAIGGGCVTLFLALRPVRRHAGAWMLGAVAAYGVATIVFSLSTTVWISMTSLIALGAVDSVSVFVRQSLVQIVTPDAMRGRVASVSGLFINASNELGEFESGVAARCLGPVGAALLGGIGALVIAAAWAGLFPALRKADRMEEDRG